jgi:hypothetical protein
VWPVIADIPLAALAAYSSRPRRLISATLLGMAIGGVALFAFARATPEPATALLDHLPLVSEKVRRHGQEMLDDRGIGAFIVQPFSGVPFKVLGLQAGIQGESWAVAPAFVVARGLRMIATGAVAHVAGRWLKRWLTGRFRLAMALYAFAAMLAWAAVTW